VIREEDNENENGRGRRGYVEEGGHKMEYCGEGQKRS
jgi:hypothetical protein